jgi:hypothetical protein
MIFSVADIPMEMPNPLGEIVEHIPMIELANRNLSQAQIESLTLMANDSVARTHELLERILKYELEWRTSVFQGETEYDGAIGNRIEAALKWWADATEALLSKMEALGQFGFRPASLETLRPRLADVRRMLTPDGEFFEGDELDELTAEALREDERGLTVEFRVMGE